MIAIPGSKGQASHLQDALSKQKKGRIGLTCAQRDQLADLEQLAQASRTTPACIGDLVPDTPVML